MPTGRNLLALLLIGAVVAACGTAPVADDDTATTEEPTTDTDPPATVAADANGGTTGSEGDTSTAEETDAPAAVTVDNCGREVSVDAVPQRVISTSQHGTEMLLALGLSDHVIGTSFTYAEPLPELAADFEAIPELAETVPPREVMVAEQPDLLLAGWLWDDTNGETGLATIEELEAMGAQALGLTAGCAEDTTALTLETTYDDLRMLGEVFDVAEAAEEVIAGMQATVDAVQEALADVEARPTALVYSNGDGPLGVAGAGLTSDILSLAGVDNVLADHEASFGRLAVEEIAALEPEVFLTVDYQPGPTPEDKADTLYQLLPEAPATTEQRAFPVPDAGLNQSVRNADTVELIARTLFPEAF